MNTGLTPAQIRKITGQFGKKKLLVYGDIGIDKYTIGKVSRISPEAPIPIVEVVDTKLKLGLAANVADNITALGGKVYMVGLVGNDSGATELKGLFKKSGLDSNHLVVDKTRRTTVKERVVAEQQQVVRIDHETRTKPDSRTFRETWTKIQKVLKTCDAVIIEDYAKGFIDASVCRSLVSAAENLGIPVFVDPNARSNMQLYFGCTLMTPNTSEAEALSGVRITDYDKLCVAGFKLLEQANARVVIITRGKEGMAIFHRGETEPLLIPTFAREVYDVSGAGDTTISMLSLALVSGATLVEAALLANYAAGVVVGKRGTATTNVSEVLEYIAYVEKQASEPKKKPKK